MPNKINNVNLGLVKQEMADADANRYVDYTPGPDVAPPRFVSAPFHFLKRLFQPKAAPKKP